MNGLNKISIKMEQHSGLPSFSLAKASIYIALMLVSLSGFLQNGLLFGSHFNINTEPVPFIEEYFYPRSIIVAFSSESIKHRSGEIEYSIDDGVVSTHLESFNLLAKEHRIVELEQLYKTVINPDWNDNGVYVQNIYRITLEGNENIEEAQFALLQDESIIWAEYETINRIMAYEPNDTMYSQQWHHRKIESPLAWDYVKGTKEVKVAITDSGVKWNHPDLAANIWVNEAELPGITIDWEKGTITGGDGVDNDGNGKIDDVLGWDFYHSVNNPYQNFPGNYHGTHVAGCVGAVGDNEIGISGVAMNVSLLVCKGASSYAESDGIRSGYEMIQYAAYCGADVINCSWGGPGQGNHANTVINQATALGSLVVTAAGNDDQEHTPSYTSYPANATNAMNIAATDQSDRKANFSDFGDDVDMTAPGVGILSTYENDGYKTANGTSMASPLVSGVAALIKTLHPRMEPLEIRQRLKDTADYIDDINQNYVEKLGTGRLNAFTATMFDKTPKISLNDFSVEELEGDNDGIPNPGETISIDYSLFNELFWMPANDVTVSLSSELPGVEIITKTLNFPNIHGGCVSFSYDNPLRFRTSNTLSEYDVPLTLTVKANQNGDYPYQVDLDFKVKLSLQKAGWPLPLTGVSTSPALIADIDADESKEIIFGDAQGKLHVVREDKSPLPGFPVELGSNINSAVAAADLNDDNNVEIVANTLAGQICCVSNEGEILFQYDAGGQFKSNPMLIDINNDGKYEIVALTFTKPKLIVLNHDGTDYPGFPINIDGGVISSPASADLNGDGQKEIIFVTSIGRLHAISVATKKDIPGFPVDLGAASWNGPTVADITGDNQPDIVVATIQGEVLGFDKTGNRILEKSIGSPIRTAVVVFDLDRDGVNEIIFGDMSGNLYVIDSNGKDVSSFPINIGAAIESTPVIADMSRNGNYDIVFGDSDGWLNSISITGKQTPNFPINLNRALTVSPTIGYVGHVDTVDILVPNQDGYQFVDFKRPIGTIGWSTFKGNMRRTGNSFDMTSVEMPVEEPALITTLEGNYPNPFNPDTTIKFTVGETYGAENSGLVPVNITVYNLRGQAVTTLVDKPMIPGNHTVSWNGTDSNGRMMSSGIYFYTLKTNCNKRVQSRKMMLVK